MTLTKSDLSSIKQVVTDVTKPQFKELEKKLVKKIDKVDKKLDTILDFLDKIEVSDLSRSTS